MRLAVFIAVVLFGCSSANANDPEFWTPSLTTESTSGGDDAAAATDEGTPPEDTGTVTVEDGGGSTIPPGNCLHVEFTTHSNGGRYSPSHVEAVWIVDGAGKFVRTLALYGFRRTGNLYRWRHAGSNTVDAITSATLTSYKPASYDWNCLDSAKKPVAPGKYTLFVEFAENDANSLSSAGPYMSVAFELGMPKTFTNPDVKNYTAVLVKAN